MNRPLFPLPRTRWVPLLLALLLPACAGTAHRQPEVPQARAEPPDLGPVNGAIYRSATARPLFEDVKARAVGDLLTVVLAENMNARKSASTTTQKESSVEMPLPRLFGKTDLDVLDNQLDASRDFKGSGNSTQSNALTGTLTVRVIDVLANGNLLVQGEKEVQLNRGKEHIRLRGLVRPQDISPLNTVSSTRVADAHITYAGTGELADANTMGWLARFFGSMLWPF